MKKSDGTYIWTLMQTMILEVSIDGLPLRSICFITDISDVKTDTKVDFVFSIKSKEVRDMIPYIHPITKAQMLLFFQEEKLKF